MFICYSVALGILGMAYQWPDLSLLLVMVLFARVALR